MTENKRCIFCKEEINKDAIICPHCNEPQKLIYKRTKFLYGTLPFSISIVSLIIALLSYNYSKSISSRQILLDTLERMYETQDKLQTISYDETKLSEKEILLLNYYEALSKTLAEHINDNRSLFKTAICTHEHSVRLREKPHPKAKQIGGIIKGDKVTHLGTYSRYYKGEEIIWHYVITNKKQIGWAYKFFEENQ